MTARDGMQAAFAVAAAVAVSGCFGDDNNDAPTDRAATQGARANLPRAIHPRCGTEQYARPEIRRARTEDGRGTRWALDYKPKARNRAAFNSLLLVEYPPTKRRFRPSPKQDTATIEGRTVAVTFPTRRSPTYAAQWQTDRAVYSIIALQAQPPRRKPTALHPTLARIVACLP